MDVTIPKANLRAFSSAIACLGRVGTDVQVACHADQLALRSLNDARSCFLCISFKKEGFFEAYKTASSAAAATAASDEDCFSCKLPVKALAKSMTRLRHTQSMRIFSEMVAGELRLVFQCNDSYEVQRTHSLVCEDCDVVHALFERNAASGFSCQPVQLARILEHIHGTVEVRLTAHPDSVSICSVHSELGAPSAGVESQVQTAMTINASEFDHYLFRDLQQQEHEEQDEQQPPPTREMVFIMKEPKAFLAYCDTTETESVTVLFDTGGQPMLMSTESNTCSAELFIATTEPLRRQTAAAGAGGGARGGGGT